MADSSGRVERIVVLLEGGGASATLEAAAALAAPRGLPLVGVYVQDPDLLSTASLPFAREIGFFSGRARPLSTADVERRMDERIEALRRELSGIGSREGISTELKVGRGRLAGTVAGLSAPGDVLVVRRPEGAQRVSGLVDALLQEARCAVLLTGRSAVPSPRCGPMVLLDDGPGSHRALARAIAFARREHAPLVLAIPPGGASRQAREVAEGVLAEHGIRARFVELPAAHAGALLRTVQRERPQLLFVSRDDPLLASAQGRALLEMETPPLVVVP